MTIDDSTIDERIQDTLHCSARAQRKIKGLATSPYVPLPVLRPPLNFHLFLETAPIPLASFLRPRIYADAWFSLFRTFDPSLTFLSLSLSFYPFTLCIQLLSCSRRFFGPVHSDVCTHRGTTLPRVTNPRFFRPFFRPEISSFWGAARVARVAH